MSSSAVEKMKAGIPFVALRGPLSPVTGVAVTHLAREVAGG